MAIWSYNLLKAQFPDDIELITLGEGETPIEEFKDINTTLTIKREDKNPTGSWKDRGTAYKLTSLLSKNIHEAVLFSSGNALISILEYCKKLKLDFKVHAVVSKNINKQKLKIIQDLIAETNHSLTISSSPKKDTIRISAERKIPNLRISIDNDIVKGYWSLGYELYPLVKNNSDVSIFCPASSGTALVGLVEGLFMRIGTEFKMPKIYVCQTQNVHVFKDELPNIVSDLEPSLADAIVDTVGLRSSQVSKIVKETKGEVLVITNQELIEAKSFVQEKGLTDLSYNSLLSIAGFLSKKNIGRNICIASGR